MKHEGTLVVGGVDAHADTHHAAALDRRGALLASESFPTTAPGYRALLSWLRAFGELDVIAVESTGSYAAGLVRYLRGGGVRVVEVNQPHAHTRRRRGRSDPIDAEMAARLALAGKATTVPKQTDGIVESIRQLRVARESAVKSRTAAMVQLRDLIVTAPQELREQLACRHTIRGEAALCRRLRPSTGELRRPPQAAKFALRSIARRIDALDDEIAMLDRRLEPLVREAAPRPTRLLGVSTGHAGRLLVTAGQNIDRLRGEAAFAALCGASPVPASSGKTTRHRLNYGGDRQANRTLHLIAVCRLRYCERTRAYARRRSAEGKTKPEIMRCLKRYIARETYNTLLADLTAAQRRPHAQPPPSSAAPGRSESPDAALDIYRNVPQQGRQIGSKGGSEIGHHIRHARCVHPDVVTPTRSGGRLRDRAAAIPRRLYATASRANEGLVNKAPDDRCGRPGAPLGAPDTPARPGECERQRGSDRHARTSSEAGL